MLFDYEKNFYIKLPWLKMTLLVCIILIICIWLFMGNINNKELSWGVLTTEIQKINTPIEGIVLECNVQVGDLIKKNDVVAKVKNIENENQLKKLECKLDETEVLLIEKESIELTIISNNIKRLNSLIKNEKNNKEIFNTTYQSIQDERELYQKHDDVVTEHEVDDLKNKENNLLITKNRIDIHTDELSKEIAVLDEKSKKIEIKHKETINKLKNEIDNLTHITYFAIKSDYSGKILEINMKKGVWISKATTLMTIQVAGKISLLSYIPHIFGKKISKDNDVHIYPTNLDKLQCTFLEGKVTEVSNIPVSYEHMRGLLPNDNTISEFYKDYCTMSELKISLKDTKNVLPGILAKSYIITNRKSPIKYVIP